MFSNGGCKPHCSSIGKAFPLYSRRMKHTETLEIYGQRTSSKEIMLRNTTAPCLRPICFGGHFRLCLNLLSRSVELKAC